MLSKHLQCELLMSHNDSTSDATIDVFILKMHFDSKVNFRFIFNIYIYLITAKNIQIGVPFKKVMYFICMNI